MNTKHTDISIDRPVAAPSEFELRSSKFGVQSSPFGNPPSEDSPFKTQSSSPPAPVTLCDGRAGLRAMVQIETRVPAPDEIQNQPSKIQSSASLAVLDFIASDDTLDRYGEILVPSGWRLDNYRRNPVFQNAHQYGDIIFTLGKALITEIRVVTGRDGRVRPALFQRIEFAVEANPMARIAYALYQGKFLNAVSVGFIPLRWEDGEAEVGRVVPNAPRHTLGLCLDSERSCAPLPSRRVEDNQPYLSPGPTDSGTAQFRSSCASLLSRRVEDNQPYLPPGPTDSGTAQFRSSCAPLPSRRVEDNQPYLPSGPTDSGTAEFRTPHAARRGSQCRRRYLEMELLEVSAVGIPANPSALQLGLQAGAIAKSDVQDLLELLRGLFELNSQSIYRGNTAGVETYTSALGADANGAQLLRFARALRELLRRT